MTCTVDTLSNSTEIVFERTLQVAERQFSFANEVLSSLSIDTTFIRAIECKFALTCTTACVDSVSAGGVSGRIWMGLDTQPSATPNYEAIASPFMSSVQNADVNGRYRILGSALFNTPSLTNGQTVPLLQEFNCWFPPPGILVNKDAVVTPNVFVLVGGASGYGSVNISVRAIMKQ